MASSRKSNSADLSERVAARIVPLLHAQCSILVGLSGGADSVALLHLLHTLSARFSWRLSALHVHHGISPNAGAWADFCTDLCARLEIPLHVEHVDIAPLRDHGIEAAARKLRHAAFAGQQCDFVALAHHADDQSETLLLQLLRGAGVRGASAMPLLSEGRPAILRPLLHCSRQEILDHARAHDLTWMEDESNADDRYPRNFLRHRVLPVLGQKFPACRDTLTRSAAHFAEASGLLDELAQQDGAQAMHANTLAVAALRALSAARAKNLLRYFLHRAGVPMPQSVQLDEMLRQLCDARRDAAVCIACGDFEVRRYQGKVHALHTPGGFASDFVQAWHGEAALEWPALQGRIVFLRGTGQGVSLARLQDAPVSLRLRCGGEALRPHPNAPTRTLKNLLQEHGIPPWQRDRMPLLYCGDELVCVPGVAIAAEYRAGTSETGVQLRMEGGATE
ncbi:MAG: tRNA lysidine(34) synthetase TilS [Nitrosomonadales bacterium]|nr:tRNA lysidine(34) synthetase TilS [Nitrosomonadales bacterium]